MPLRATKPIIQQSDLRRIVAINLEIARLKRQRDRLLEDLFRNLKEGASVEPGTHRCELETSQRGAVLTERVWVR